MKTMCNNCKDEFELEPANIQMTEIEDLNIQFFLCPSCGQKYVVFAADDEMKKLVVARTQIQKQIKTARLGKFRRKTIQQLIGEQTKLIRKQEKLLAELKPRAEKLLKEAENDEKTNNE